MQVIAESIDYIVAHPEAVLDLDHLARRAGYEPTYFQKIFKSHVGLSPKQLQKFMTLRRAQEIMRDNRGKTLFDIAHDTGLSGTGRLHDLFVTCEAITPGQARYKGEGVKISYGFVPTPLGDVLVAKTERGVCYLGFVVEQSRDIPVSRMKAYLPQAKYTEDIEAVEADAEAIMKIWGGQKTIKRNTLKLELHGTNMQIQVWQALLKIPCGRLHTYGGIAQKIGKPKAARAVGNAVGANPVSLLIPCHRVIRSTGIIDNYGWGNARKKQLLGMEAVHTVDIN